MKRRVASGCHLDSTVRVMDRHALLYLLCLLYTTHQADSFLFNQGVCRENYVMCETGETRGGIIGSYNNNGRGCIPRKYVCDGGTPDCRDGSDEKYCPYDTAEPKWTNPTPTEQASTTTRPETDVHLWTRLLTGFQEVPLFALRVGVKMRQLDSQTYLQAERLINQVLFEAQMGNITHFNHLRHCSKHTHS